jgi:type IV secretion system protein VirD4
MYRLARVLMMMSVLTGMYCLVIVAVLYRPWGMVLLAAALFALRVGQRRSPLTTLGSARFAERSELYQSGAIGGESGIIVGQLAQGRPRVPERLRMLFDRRIDARALCRSFWLNPKPTGCDVIRLNKAVHTAIFAPSGAGKGVSLLTPFALDCCESMVIFDPKGELATRTARHREKRFRQRVALVDPYRLVTKHPDGINPFDWMADGPELIDDCNALADALVVQKGTEHDPHWNASAIGVIAALSLLVALCGKPGKNRSLQMVKDTFSHPEKFNMAVQALAQSDCLGGIPARMGGQLMHLVDRERSSVLSTTGRHLRFLDSIAVAESTRQSTFDPLDLRRGRLTVYLILPSEHLRTQAALVRMWLSSLMRVVIRGGVQE